MKYKKNISNKRNKLRFCRDCGEQIHPKRLLAIPNATKCIDCQEENDVFKYRGILTQNEEGDLVLDKIERDERKWKKFIIYTNDILEDNNEEVCEEHIVQEIDEDKNEE